MAKVYQIPEEPELWEIPKILIILGNNIARLTKLVARYQARAGFQQAAYKRAVARAKVTNKSAGNQELIKSMAEIDPVVSAIVNKMELAEAKLTLAKGELDGYEAQFISMRKIVEIKKMEKMFAGDTGGI